MIFGDTVRSPVDSSAAEWLRAARTAAEGSIGWLVPGHHASIVRVHAPMPGPGWWSEYRDLVAFITSVGARHTSTPDTAWFAVWEGHGWAKATSHIATFGALTDAERQDVEHRRAMLRAEDERRNAAIHAGLSSVARVEHPYRAYYLMTGPLSAATELREPGTPERWQHPDLIWPDDHRWFAATDVDIWSYYVGGDDDFIADVVDNSPTPTEPVAPDRYPELED